jgi:hypothetical protein
MTPTPGSVAGAGPVDPFAWLGDILGLPWWLGLGTIAIIITLLWMLYAAWRKRTGRILSYEILSDTPLVSSEEEAEPKGRLVITFDNQPVQSIKIRSVVFSLRS